MNFVAILLLSLSSLLMGGEEADLVFFGDAMQHEPQIKAAQRANGAYDYSACFRHVSADIDSADYAVVNFECTLGGKPYSGYPCFSAPDSYARQLRDVGFDLLLTANNHCLDTRDRGLRRTCQMLDKMGIPHIGTYQNQAERDERLPFIAEVNNIRIAFLDYTYGTNGIRIQGDVVVDYIDRDLIAADIAAAREAGAEVICVNMHWGIEYTTTPVKSQRELADFLVDQGVDLIIGGHPHVVEPMEMRFSPKYGKSVLVVYSLGNFISNQKDIDCRGGAMVKLRLRRNEGQVEIVDPRYKLFFVQKPAGGSNYEVIPEDRPDLLRADSKPEFTSFMRRARAVMSHNVLVPPDR